MSTFRVSTRFVRHTVIGAVLASAAGCLPAVREMGQHPHPLAGDWVDPKHTTAADTSVWRLAPSGADMTVHVRPGAGGATSTRVSRHGIWFLRGALGDTARRALCFNRRPGRNGSSCTLFSLDTLPDGRLRMTLHDYRGTHETATRTLEERRP